MLISRPRVLFVSAALACSCVVPEADAPSSGLDELEQEITGITCPESGPFVELCHGEGSVWTALYRAGHSEETSRTSEVAQTFVASRNGAPGRVRLKLRLLRDLVDGESPELTVHLRPMNGTEVPTSSAADIATATLSAAGLPRGAPLQVEFVLKPVDPLAPVAVVEDGAYALVLTSASGTVHVGVSSLRSDASLPGRAWTRVFGAGGEDKPFTANTDDDLAFSFTLGDGEVCVGGDCVLSHCADGARSVDESDVDCGGASCDRCGVGEACDEGGDCESGSCPAGVCLAPTCSDGVANGTETDVDCGGSCGPCGTGEGCVVNADCMWNDACVEGTCAPKACVREDFNAGPLGAHWSVTAGAAPTYGFVGERLRVTDAAFAAVWNNASRSWIDNLDYDKGNQLSFAFPVGLDDFDVRFSATWASNDAELGIGAIGLTDANGRIEAYLGGYDGSGTAPGHLHYLSRGSSGWGSATAASISGEFRLVRTAGTLQVYVNDVLRQTNAFARNIQRIALVTVRHKEGTSTYGFGTFDLDWLEACR